jgi:hypothetical protein
MTSGFSDTFISSLKTSLLSMPDSTLVHFVTISDRIVVSDLSRQFE